MMQPTERGNKPKSDARRSADLPEDLPFSIEIWNEARSKVERVIARAQNASLARAIFKAACEENPERRLILRRGTRTLASNN